jgi:cell wall-associated NlpC family hydrolase
MSDYTPKPGDIFMTQITGPLGVAIRIAQGVVAGDRSRYTHAGVCLGDGFVIEAMPGGARIAPLAATHTRRPLAYSAFELDEDTRERIVAAARGYEGVGYSLGTYLTLGLLGLGLRPRWLRKRVHGTGRMICSQLCDRAYRDAGVQLFDDGRDSGDVTPGDLAHIGRIRHVGTGPYVTTGRVA